MHIWLRFTHRCPWEAADWKCFVVHRVPDGTKHILRRLEAALAVVPAMVAAGARFPSDALIRFLKAMSQALTVASLHVLHVQAAGSLLLLL